MASPAPPTPVIRDAGPGDVEAIRSVAETTWWATYEELRGPEWIREHLAEFYSPELLAEQIEAAAAGDEPHFLIAEAEGKVVGYLHFLVMDDRGPYLRRLYVLPEFHGSGFGRALVIELHRRLGAGARYQLDVHPENHKAVGFYLGFGAHWTGERLEPCWDLMEVAVDG